jgi:hypothetical protein
MPVSACSHTGFLQKTARLGIFAPDFSRKKNGKSFHLSLNIGRVKMISSNIMYTAARAVFKPFYP